MDRLNQLRGDAGTSRECSLDTSSLAGDGYLTANDSSKYFSLAELDSSTESSPPKDAADDVTPNSTLLDAERIISNLSPIPKKSEMGSFKIGDQIEAANILSGGVNIFDDNENSYDGDELVIDDAAVERDDNAAELKLDDNTDYVADTFEKTEQLADTNTEEADAANLTKDTEVVLQIDGKNVGAIDIGNGLYLYRKDGEEELAAVQILDNNQQQPDIKFLKVRENSEGNLEVYEEIEIEVPKEVPTKEGKATHVQDIYSEPANNKVISEEINEVELHVNKDNNHICNQSTTNGKIFGDSRKSPLIGTFTPMTYHSTPNKERIPLTKTMVDLQLHPNRHSENVKKTIEVHTDCCKQRLLEIPTKSIRESNEHSKSPEFMSLSLDKDLTNDIIAHGPDQNSQENNNKDINSAIIENKTDEIITFNINNDKNIYENKSQNLQAKPLDTNSVESNVSEDKTEISDIKIPSLTNQNPPASMGAQCEYNTENVDEGIGAKTLRKKSPVNETCSKTKNDIVKNKSEVNDLRTQTEEEERRECSKSKYIKENEDIVKGTMEKEMETTYGVRDTHADNATTENLSISPNLLKKNNAELYDVEIKGVSNVKVSKSNPIETLESSPNSLNLISNQEVKHCINKTLHIWDNSTKDLKLDNNTEMKNSENQPVQSLRNSADEDNEKTKNNTQSEITNLQKKMAMDVNVKPLQEEPTKAVQNLLKPTEIKTDTLLQQPESSVKMFHSLSKEQELNTFSDLKKDNNEPKDNLPEALEKKSKTDLNTFKPENEPVDIVQHCPKNLNINETTEVETNKNEHKIKPDHLSKGPVKKVNAELNQPDEALGKPSVDAFQLVPNTEFKSTHQNLLNIEKKCRNSLPTIKTSTAEKTEIQNTLFKNMNVSLLTSDSKTHLPIQNLPNERSKNDIIKESNKVTKVYTSKPINNNETGVPFGKWTNEHKQEFIKNMKEPIKVPINTSNTKQLKQPNDLNRRDVLQKIDSQRQSSIASAKAQKLSNLNKIKLKHETATFGSKSNVIPKEKTKDNEVSPLVANEVESIPITSVDSKIGYVKKVDKEPPLPVIPVDILNTSMNTKKDPVHRKEINNQDLIDKTIEGIINRAVTAKLGQDDSKQNIEPVDKLQNATSYTPISLDEIESKMNELHGIPFVERPPHQLPQVIEHENKGTVVTDVSTAGISTKTPSVLPLAHKLQQNKELKLIQPVSTRVHEDSDEEIIEHVPLTGDIGLNKNNLLLHGQVKGKIQPEESIITKVNLDSKKESIITENDFDKFARRNSITYENCLTVNFDGKEHHNVIKTIVEKEAAPKKLSRNEIMLAESKAKCNKQLATRHLHYSSKIPTMIKTTKDEDSYNNKNYQSKVQIAYQSVMTAKRQQESPVTIIEDKPVKVVYMEGNHEYTPHQLNVQGRELSPPKKSAIEWDHFTHSTSESLDSSESALDAGYDSKSQDDIKFKSKHQRKQVLTPVEAPELELIEPGDLGIEVSPKKKRKVEDNKPEKNSKSLVPKKSYLLNRNITIDDAPSNSHDLTKTPLKDSINQQDVFVKHSDPISAIDNLVKAAELLETQSESKHVLSLSAQNSPTEQNTPIKRGRGRPRKYPIPEAGSDNKNPSLVKVPTPQKKPRLMDAKIPKYETDSDDDEIDSDGELVKENWSMGKINKNIICPICNKLFRTEYVVFKHVKHCTGPSPSRSDSDKRSPRRMRPSQELDWKSEGSKSDSRDVDEDYETNKPTKNRKSKERRSSIDEKPEAKADVIVIEDTPVKDNPPIRKREKLKHDVNKAIVNTKIQQDTSSLVCDICGKTFRQLSYLVNHKLQHKNTESKKIENDHVQKSLFSCEICKKEFRKLHHLVQHRNIHSSMSTSRKSSSDQSDSKREKDVSRAIEDQSAGFRCEPCDKSFRKLHHLVEHRETHDEINKKCNPAANSSIDSAKPNPLHHCEICKKTFKKLQHLIEHKEHHLDTSSEKSDDKSVKSSLSTRDIIHECPLCYMVFPNEHSLNKHNIICQRKKKQSAAKQSKQIDESDIAAVEDEIQATEADDENLVLVDQKTDNDTSCVVIDDELSTISEKQETTIPIPLENEHKKESELKIEIKPEEIDLPLKLEVERKSRIPDKQIKSTNKKDGRERNNDKVSVSKKLNIVPPTGPVEIINIPDTPALKKRSLIAKDKIGATITKRQKSTNVSLPIQKDIKAPETSDDDEIRYMLNPDFQMDESTEGKQFMKVRANKRNSLQIERPNSKDLIKRRISLQHPPKISRLKVKPIPRKTINTNTVVKSSRTTRVPLEALPSVDSDDSDVKYSFPKSVMKEMAKEEQKKVKRQTMVEKRKSLSNIAKRKSLGKTVSTTKKVNPSPVKQIKKRTREVEHRCDCGQLFSSAAMLTRHTSLAHTPPRIRRRRSPPPDDDNKPTLKRTEKPQETRKLAKPNPTPKKTGVATRTSSVNSEVRATGATRKRPSASLVKTPRNTAHKGVPLPDKMRKLQEKSKK